ncbi:MAG: hypothetical protein DRI86_14680 [Bacteroidetes bacterium]|nr:MAG: hypothetical protein DRI86_14680 [Bacteroidota bacterium]
MRKYILGSIILGLGIIILFYSILKNKNIQYPETIFTTEANSFKSDFAKFLKTTKSNVINLQTVFSDTNKIKDPKFSEEYFLNFIKKNPYLISVAYIQGKHKAAIKREDKTYVIAIDSNRNTEIVHWKRLNKGKIISEWEESFSESINNTIWYNSLINHPNEIQWFFDISKDITSDYKTDNELFYAGYYYKSNKNANIILLRFSRLSLLRHFSTYSKYEKVNLLIETTDNKRLDLGTGITEIFKEIANDKTIKDSTTIIKLQHFNKFNELDSGIFSFSNKGEVYWNSFMRFDALTGIKYYLLSIPQKDIQVKINSKASSKYIYIISILLIISGGGVFFIKREVFYNRKRYKFQSVVEILSSEDENRYLEFKSSLRWDYRQEKVNPDLEQVIIKTICAFGNTDGGILLIGVDDDKNILGLENDFKTLKKPNADFFEIHLRNILHTLMGVRYVSKNIRMNFEEAERGKIVCSIKVFAADEAIFLKTKNKNGQLIEKFYVRSGNSSQEIKTISEINEYINSRFNN